MVREKGIDLRKPLIRTRGGGVRAGGGSNPSDAPAPATRYTITATSSNTRQGTVTGGGTYTEGDTVTLRATAKSGYEFTGWYSGSSKVSSNSTYTFTASQNITLVARFAEVQADFYFGAVNTPSGNDHAADYSDLIGQLTGGYLADNNKATFNLPPQKTYIILYDATKVVPSGYKVTTPGFAPSQGTDFDDEDKFYRSTKENGNVTYNTIELLNGNRSDSITQSVEITFAANSNSQE